jgi:small subunit ribosomal protein S9
MKDTKAKYIETVGRRKTSIARVRMTPDSKSHITINERTLADYFPTKDLEINAISPLAKTEQKFKVTVVVSGGGISSQSDSVKLGLARGIVEFDAALRGTVKKDGLLKRDPRAKERRKFGLKKARKAPQWSKR